MPLSKDTNSSLITRDKKLTKKQPKNKKTKEATQTIQNRPTKYTQYIYKRIKLRLFKYN